MTFRSLLLLALSVAALSGCPDTNSRTDFVDASRPLSDALTLPDTFIPGADAGAVSCEPMRASASVCPGAICDGPDSVIWDGEQCVQVDCGTCIGEDCGRAYRTMAECTAAQRGCVPQLCRATGGDWLFWAEECVHRNCGRPVPATCIVGMPVCDCGPRSNFDPLRGCVPDVGCERDGMPTPEYLCTNSGGTWENVCGPSHCGVASPLACTQPACTCGRFEVWDALRGCVESSECRINRPAGDTCAVDGDIRCGSGLICCQSCGGAGCFGDPTCRMPTCDPSGMIDVCGNNRMAP